jgi:hypothetical protein
MDVQELFDNEEHVKAILDFLIKRFSKNQVQWQLFKMAVEACPCGGQFAFSPLCGANVCHKCGNHRGLERCYCGWSLTNPGHGRQELIEMGETIDPEE